MKLSSEIRALEKWLEKEGNGPAKLAYLLGYRSSSTISKWIKTNTIPRREREKVLDLIKGATSEHSKPGY